MTMTKCGHPTCNCMVDSSKQFCSDACKDLASSKGHVGAMIAMEQETWQGDTLRFRMRVLGQTAAASIEVLEDALRLEVSLPWLLAKAAKRLLPILRKEASLLLEKK